MDDYVELATWQVAAISGLILINATLSLYFRLRLEVSLLIASFRTLIQLVLLGLILQWVFTREHPLWLGLIAAAMTGFAAWTAQRRCDRTYPTMWLDTLTAIGLSSWLIGWVSLRILFFNTDQWWDSRFVIPILGMILGNGLNGITIGLSSFTQQLVDQRNDIDARLALGATRFEAALPTLQAAIRIGMMPIINSMMVVGLVSLPGMMTGQLLAGAEPMDAVKYQMCIMFVIASATALGTVGVVLLGYRRLFNAEHQFLFDRIQTRQPKQTTG